MANINPDRIISAIDIGTTKICVLVAHRLDDTEIEVIGVGRAPSSGLHRGVVVDIAKAVHSISTAVKEAELMAGVQIESAVIGISGGHICSTNSHGLVPIKSGEIRISDVTNVLEAAKAIAIKDDQQVLHILPQYFVIDGRDTVHDPVGMHGVRLEVQTHIILGSTASVQNLITCCQNAGVLVTDIILEQLASADAVLSNDERELGVAVIDIGGGTSDLAIYQHGSIRHTMVLPVAGNHFTNDIAIGLRTTIADAERIKKEFGIASYSALKQDTFITVELVQGDTKQVIQASDLVRILQPRAEEILTLIHREITGHNVGHFITTGIVLTGGGSLLNGIEQIARTIFDQPVRIGKPQLTTHLPESLRSPLYATGYGLLVHTLKKKSNARLQELEGPLVKRVVERMKLWVTDFF